MSKSNFFSGPDGYAPVAERLRLFWERYPNGRIHTALKRRTRAEVVFVARVYREVTDRSPAATGWAAEREGDGDINLVACLENTETSAVGRALANLGFTASNQRPSAEEMLKASRVRANLTKKGEREVRKPIPTLVVSKWGDAGAPKTGVGALTVLVDSVPEMDHPMLLDLLKLLSHAERAGVVRPRRAARWRGVARNSTMAQLERLEEILRARLARAGA